MSTVSPKTKATSKSIPMVKLFGPYDTVFPMSEVTPVFPYNIYTGIELEIEGVSSSMFSERYISQYPDSAWFFITDDSLRGNNCEAILKVPLYGKKLQDSIDSIYTTIDSFRKSIIPSYRTSTHIHLDVKNLNIKELLNVFLCYAMVEEVFYAFHRYTNRRNSVFCTPVAEYVSAESILHDLSTCKDAQGIRYALVHFTHQDHRYKSINLSSLPKHGSIELRFLPLIKHKEELTFFINIFHSIYTYATSIKSMEHFIKNMLINKEFIPLAANGMFDKYLPFVKERVPEVEKLMYEGVNKVKTIFLHKYNQDAFEYFINN